MLPCLRPSYQLPVRRFFCRSASVPNIEKYIEAFAGRMAMAGVKPHHRIALGVSGGPDSMALCVLAAEWKTSNGSVSKTESSALVDGLLGIIVDHRLRPESTDEANLVRGRLLKMGIECNIASCDWSDGQPKKGHLQEAARDMRYQIFQDVCNEYKINVLLVAHHSDDQAELFILRLSRNSGIIGLAGMAFASQLFPTHVYYCGESSSNDGLLLVRPMLNFSKNDMYKVCEGGLQEWVEDPSNKSQLFARNRIRISLKNLSKTFWSELQTLISACRSTRVYVEHICSCLIQKCVTIMDHGYVIIDLNKLNPSNVEDLCLLKFLATIMQFVSQRHRPIRGGVSNLLLDYIRNIPCKTSLTAAGCYLCSVPKSRGTRILVTVSLDSPQPLWTKIFYKKTYEGPRSMNAIDEIIMGAKLYSDRAFDTSNFLFRNAVSSEAVLKRAKECKIISESTYNIILSLKTEEEKNFSVKRESKFDAEIIQKMKSNIISSIQLNPGCSCHFMGRFLVTWKSSEKIKEDKRDTDDFKATRHNVCLSCLSEHKVAYIRCMVDADWLYLANVSKGQALEYQNSTHSVGKIVKTSETTGASEYMASSAQRALHVLKSIPAPSRRSLPVLVDGQDLPICIPSINFQRCPSLSVTVRFEPRIPLGGGYSSFL